MLNNKEKGALVNLLIGTILAIVAAVGMGVDMYNCGLGVAACDDFIPGVELCRKATS